MRYIFFAVLTLLALSRAEAQVINEISYSPTSKQWVEIYNNTDAVLDLALYKILDSGASVNGHGITAVSGGLIPAHDYGVLVISSNTSAVSATYLYKASLGIKTTGDTIVLKKGTSVIDTTTFSDGVVTSGNSLQKQVDGTWVAALPTPGGVNTAPPAPPIDAGSGTASTTTATTTESADTSTQATPAIVSSHYSFVPISNFEPGASYKVSAGRNRLGFVGLPLAFKATTNTNDPNSTYFWNFGDGSTATGRDPQHIYGFPGRYIVVLNSELMGSVAVSRVTVNVVEPEVFITEVTPSHVSITNKSKYEVNLYGWHLASLKGYFEFPLDTIIGPGETVTFPGGVTKLYPANQDSIALMKKDESLNINASLASAREPQVIPAIGMNPDKQKQIDDLTMQLSHAEKVLSDMLSGPSSASIASIGSSTDNRLQTAAAGESLPTSNSHEWLSTMKHFFGLR
ncbi:lamin tail domain-containing protein [Candidatus Parcubacteria bacterium]|nr:lamin tail domain-containing protein [Candidatus Parcubacteria bacterium]